jgi:FAD/FMN-containing dehydrogenase
MKDTNWNHRSINELEAFLKDKIFRQDTTVYNGILAGLWTKTDSRPAMICQCETVADVQAAVALAVKNGMRLSVRGGGHDLHGRASVHEGFVIDLSKLKTITIDAQQRVATIAGGVTSGELITAAEPLGLLAVVGTGADVGVAGFSTAGGYGLTSPTHGLGADNLLEIDIVLADGRLVTASKTENPDLLWAHRGGGANFGVIVSMRIRLHRVKNSWQVL